MQVRELTTGDTIKLAKIFMNVLDMEDIKKMDAGDTTSVGFEIVAKLLDNSDAILEFIADVIDCDIEYVKDGPPDIILDVFDEIRKQEGVKRFLLRISSLKQG